MKTISSDEGRARIKAHAKTERCFSIPSVEISNYQHLYRLLQKRSPGVKKRNALFEMFTPIPKVYYCLPIPTITFQKTGQREQHNTEYP